MSTAPRANLPDTSALLPPPPRPLRRLPPAVAAPTAAFFGGLSRARGKRAMHPVGLVTAARLKVPDDPLLPTAWRNLDGASGIIRFSKAIGLPGGLPDVLGLALRFGEQDLLLASAAGSRVGFQHLLAPAAGFGQKVFSSLLGHRVGDNVAVIQGYVPTQLPDAATYLEAVRWAVAAQVQLTAVSLGGRRRALGIVEVGDVIDGPAAARVRFDPWRSGGGLDPVGPIQRLRSAAYAGSRRATRS